MATNADMIEDSQVHTFNAEIAIMYNQGYNLYRISPVRDTLTVWMFRSEHTVVGWVMGRDDVEIIPNHIVTFK